ncbi:hypothetical protein [Mesoterricola sediminis]|uniref:Uncharacterized protein n=1 Tax=Mesoterricola sediminis TaxID=2927980 RepID=A0AA48GVX3_9BACT|nr:hypothetical protein [Mesoterricola sediminis]BDU75047.1 hypothetical protein METESE_00050 [Mesoterricola sediminis]
MHFHVPHPHFQHTALFSHVSDVMNVVLILLGLLVALLAAGGYTVHD